MSINFCIFLGCYFLIKFVYSDCQFKKKINDSYHLESFNNYSHQKCSELLLGPFDHVKKFVVLFETRNAIIDCNHDKIIVYNESYIKILDYCEKFLEKNSNFIGIKHFSKSLFILYSHGSTSNFSVSFNWLAIENLNSYSNSLSSKNPITSFSIKSTTSPKTTRLSTTEPKTTRLSTTSTNSFYYKQSSSKFSQVMDYGITTTIFNFTANYIAQSNTTNIDSFIPLTNPLVSTLQSNDDSTTTLITATIPSTEISNNFKDEDEFSSCGLTYYSLSQNGLRIVGGGEAEPHSHPWQVYLTDYTGRLACAGSLINDRWILTVFMNFKFMQAAHCVYAKVASNLLVYLGSHDLSKYEKNYRKVLNVSKIIMHQYYNKFHPLENDVALLKLEKSINFTKEINPICLAKKSPDLMTSAIVTGWGRTVNKGHISNILNQVSILIRDQKFCEPIVSLRKSQICAGNTLYSDGFAKDSCQGDSGGPLIQKINKRYYLIGIVSFGSITCDGLGVYTNVFSFLDWINWHIKITDIQ